MRATTVLVILCAALVAACSGRSGTTRPTAGSGSGGGASSGGGARAETPQTARGANGNPARGPRHLNGVPPGHYPKPGECRLWVPGRPPGKQAPATSCASLSGRVPAGAFLLYGGRAWDADWDWAAQARRERGSVPDAVLTVLRGRR